LFIPYSQVKRPPYTGLIISGCKLADSQVLTSFFILFS
jgi:hypothetical protein